MLQLTSLATLIVLAASQVAAVPRPMLGDLHKRSSGAILPWSNGWLYKKCLKNYTGTELTTDGTPQSCMAACSRGNPYDHSAFTACALFNNGRCIGSDKWWLDSMPVVEPENASDCLGSCTGDASLACATHWTALLYLLGPEPVAPTTMTTATVTPTTTTTTTTTTASTTTEDPTTTITSASTTSPTSAPSPTATRLLNDPTWTYKNCYDNSAVGDSTVRDLVPAGEGKWTIEGCLAAVEDAGFSVGGIIYGGEWGSDTIPDKNLIQDSSMCNWKCNDNKGELCGGEHSLDVYFVRQTTKLIDDDVWSYQGCYADDLGARTLENLVRPEGEQTWTIEKCLAAVELAGYSVGGVEYGGECWGANFIRGSATKLATSSCNMRCNDAADNTCGGDTKIDVYTRRKISSSTTTTVVSTSP